MIEVTGMKVDRQTAQAMFPEQYRVSKKFDDALHKLIMESMEENTHQEQVAFAAITASLTMQLAKMFAVTKTDPLSVIKTFSEVIMSTYKEYMKYEKEKKSA